MSVTLVDTIQLLQSVHASTCHGVVVCVLVSRYFNPELQFTFFFFLHTYSVYSNFFTRIKHNYIFFTSQGTECLCIYITVMLRNCTLSTETVSYELAYFLDNTARGTKLH